MKKSSLAYSAVILIVLIALFLGLRIWASERAVSFEGPAAIKRGTDGIIYIMSNDFLYLHDKEGDLLDKIPMSKFGIENVIGDFWVYKSGDLLVRRDVPQTLTVSGEAELFARTGAGENDRIGTGEGILQRCSFETFQCKNFGGGGEVFDKLTAFSLMVDEEREITYLSDTVGHQLLMIDNNGNVIKRSNTPFQFPNQIALEDDGLLYVADTNNHRVAAVKTEKENFGAVEKEFKIVYPGKPFKPTWPMALARVPDKKWWVINADNNMSYGIVMILSEKGVFEKVVPLPGTADPLRLVATSDRVLITDPSAMRVYSVSQNGELGDDFGSLTFRLDLSELRRKRRLYELIASTSMWSLLILLASAMVLARQARIQQAAEPKQAEPRPAAGTVTRAASGATRYDYHSVIGLHRIKFAVITIMLLAAVAFLLLISRGLTLFPKEFIPATLLGHFVVSFFTHLHLKRSYVEITERGITYQGMSRNIHSPWNGVKKISVSGNVRIVTDYGNFSIGKIEPADSPPRGWLDVFQKKRAKFLKELIEEIQQRAPQAKVKISWIMKYHWKRL